jgi:hypothetical protein
MGTFMLKNTSNPGNGMAEPRDVCFTCDTMAANQDPGGCTGGTCAADCSSACHFTCVAFCVDKCSSNCTNICHKMLVLA